MELSWRPSATRSDKVDKLVELSLKQNRLPFSDQRSSLVRCPLRTSGLHLACQSNFMFGTVNIGQCRMRRGRLQIDIDRGGH